MRSLFQRLCYFTRKERRGIAVLTAGCILIAFLSGSIYSHRREKPSPMTEEGWQPEESVVTEYTDFIASMQEPEAQREQRFADYEDYKQPQPPLALTAFDPNIADSATFLRLGLPGWMTQNILKYRAKGGKFRKEEDFKKIYGLTEEQYRTLQPYIRISPEETTRHTAQLYTPAAADSAALPRTPSAYKYPAGTLIDLNRADTTELKKIPGIGSGIARLITNHRQRLGGFYRIEQLAEVRLDASQLKSWFRIDTTHISRINLNRAGIERLRNHPYISFYQAKALVEYRKKKGTIRSLKPFRLYEEFTEEDLERIGHYVCFEP